jgi:hypothetical protein
MGLNDSEMKIIPFRPGARREGKRMPFTLFMGGISLIVTGNLNIRLN